MSIETGCPPHEAVLDRDGVLVCRLCESRLGVECLGCIVEQDGWLAQHVCWIDPAPPAIGLYLLALLALVATVAALAV